MFIFCYQCINAYVVCLLLVLAGDVELNPGPDGNSNPQPSLESIAMAISRIECSQNTVLSELALIRAAQSKVEDSISSLSSRVDALEKIAETNQLSCTSSVAGPDMAKLSSDIKLLSNKCDDAENRLRRTIYIYNLLFFGITDKQDETWSQSESRITSFCSQELDITINSHDIERAHRLGRYQPGKNRPIIVSFMRFKDKGQILSASSKLKNSPFSVREDYSARVRLARKKLFSYGKQSTAFFKIRFDKLIMNNKQFVYNAGTDSVVELNS